MSIPLNERAVQLALWSDMRTGHAPVVPNFAPAQWMECDVFAVSKSGYWSEHEIKLSVSDFKADAKKVFSASQSYDPILKHSIYRNELKHTLLGQSVTYGPNRFWYVVPDEIEDKIVLPHFAGLKVINWDAQRGRSNGISVRRSAPLLHKDKVRPRILEQASACFFYRYWTQIEIVHRLQRRRS